MILFLFVAFFQLLLTAQLSPWDWQSVSLSLTGSSAMNKLRQSFRRKKDVYVPESSRPHQWQTDEEGVRTGKCSFAVKVTLTILPRTQTCHKISQTHKLTHNNFCGAITLLRDMGSAHYQSWVVIVWARYYHGHSHLLDVRAWLRSGIQ